MKMFPRWFLLFTALLFALPDSVFAGSKGPVHVRAYTRRDGTYVAAHDRRAPGTASVTVPATSTRYTQPTSPASPMSNVPPAASVSSYSPGVSSNSATRATTAGDLPHVRENWSPGKIVSGKYIPGHYAKTSLRAAATQLAGSFIESPSGSVSATSTTVERDANGRIKRSQSAKHSFMRMTGYPHGRPGYVVDHVIPLKRGGPDDPSNMQWQTVEEAKAKDKSE